MMPVSPSSSGPDLRDIHLPPAPSWWPLASGWWMLGALLLVMSIAAAWFWLRRHRLLRERRRLLDELEKLVAHHVHDGDDVAFATSLNQLLRRVARRHDETATTQRGERWRKTLARVPVAPAILDRLAALEQAIYRPQAEFDAHATLSAARDWLRAASNGRAWKPSVMESRHV
jgi:hypothetical protein